MQLSADSGSLLLLESMLIFWKTDHKKPTYESIFRLCFTFWESQACCLWEHCLPVGSDSELGELPLEEGMATHSSTLTWRIPWTGKPGGLQSMGSQKVGDNWVTNTFTFFSLLVIVKTKILTNWQEAKWLETYQFKEILWNHWPQIKSYWDACGKSIYKNFKSKVQNIRSTELNKFEIRYIYWNLRERHQEVVMVVMIIRTSFHWPFILAMPHLQWACLPEPPCKVK